MSIRVPSSFLPKRTLSNVDPSLRQFWHPVATADEVGSTPIRVDLLDTPWVLARLGDRISAMWDRCPHRLVPLSQGTVKGDRLQCRYHGYEFDADGACRHIPALGADTPPTHIGVPTAHVRTAFGLIWICAASEAPPFPLDESPYLDPDVDTFLAGPFETPVGAGILTDNFLDVTHLPFLHVQTFGGDTPAIHALNVTRDGWSLRQTTDSVSNERGEPVPVR